MKANQRITAEGHFQDVRHVEVELAGVTYAPGHVLHVWPVQSKESVEEVLSRLGEDGGRCGGATAPFGVLLLREKE